MVEVSDDGGDLGGGSFWATFGGPASGPQELSPLETLLQSPDCSIEAMLEDEEVIQEFKAGNDKLLARLRTMDACLLLVDYITRDPPENASNARCYRYPFVSVELMTCNPELFTFFVQDENTQLLDALWGFMKATPPAETNPVLAGYFSRAVAILLSKHTPEVVAYLRKSKLNEDILDCFLDRMHSRSLAELFARLVCQELHSQMIFPFEGLVMRLLSRLQDAAPMSDAQENITLVILELINQKEVVCFGPELIAQLTSTQAIKLLVDHVFSGKAASVAAAASILSSIVQNTCFGKDEGRDFASPATLTPVSPPLLALGLDDDDLVNIGMEDPLDDFDAVSEANRARASGSSSSPPCSPALSPSRLAASSGSGLMQEVTSYFPRIRALLDAVLGRGVDMVPLPGGEVPAVGSTTIEVMNLLTILVRTGSEEIFKAIQQEHLLSRCLEIFFRHPWSSLLHNCIRLMLTEVLSSTEGVRPTLVLQLLQENGLVERLVNEYREEQAYVSGSRKKHPRVGYMGHLHDMCQGLISFGRDCEQCGAALEAVSGWTDVVLVAIAARDKLHNVALGGGIPEGSAGLASSGGMHMSDVSGGISGSFQNASEPLDDDFVLDDLVDFDGSPRAGSDSTSPTRSGDFGGGFDPDGFSSPTSSGSGGNSCSPPEPWTASFGGGTFETQGSDQRDGFDADFGQANTFKADFGQENNFSADFGQANTFEADFGQATPGAQPEEPAAASGSFWDIAAMSSETPALTPASPWEQPVSASKEAPAIDSPWGAFDTPANSTVPAKVAAQSAPAKAAAKPEETSLRPEDQNDLLNALGGSAASSGTEKRDDGSWGASFAWPAPGAPVTSKPVAAVPSTIASTSLEDLSWDAFGSGASKPTPPTGRAEAVGSENLFALLGSNSQVPAASPALASLAAVGLAGPAAPSPAATPWQWDNFGGSTSSASPSGAMGGMDPFGPLVPPASSASSVTPTGSDRSWVADFDPLGGVAPSTSSPWPENRGDSNGQKPSLATLDLFT